MFCVSKLRKNRGNRRGFHRRKLPQQPQTWKSSMIVHGHLHLKIVVSFFFGMFFSYFHFLHFPFLFFFFKKKSKSFLFVCFFLFFFSFFRHLFFSFFSRPSRRQKWKKSSRSSYDNNSSRKQIRSKQNFEKPVPCAFGEKQAQKASTALCSAVLAQSGTDAMVPLVPWPVPWTTRQSPLGASQHAEKKNSCGQVLQVRHQRLPPVAHRSGNLRTRKDIPAVHRSGRHHRKN